jgi:hypothetical protein
MSYLFCPNKKLPPKALDESLYLIMGRLKRKVINQLYNASKLHLLFLSNHSCEGRNPDSAKLIQPSYLDSFIRQRRLQNDDISHQLTSYITHLPSYIKHPTSPILRLMSNIFYLNKKLPPGKTRRELKVMSRVQENFLTTSFYALLLT